MQSLPAASEFPRAVGDRFTWRLEELARFLWADDARAPPPLMFMTMRRFGDSVTFVIDYEPWTTNSASGLVRSDTWWKK